MPLPFQIASNLNLMSQTLGGARTTSNQLIFNRRRIVIPAGGVDSELVLEFSNVYVAQNTTNAPEAAAAAFTGRMHLEIDGVVKVLTFGGSTSKSIAAGALKVKTDPITAADFPGVTGIGTQEKVAYIGEERLYAVGATPAYYSATTVHSIPGNSTFSGPATAPSKIGVPGPATDAGGYSFNYAIFGGWTLTARPKVKSPAVLALGASIENYVSDNFGDGIDGKGGYVLRAAAKSPVIALSNLSVSGDSWRGFAANSAARVAAMQYANIIIFGYGGNDFTNGETSAATISRMNAAITLAKSTAPNAKVAVLHPMTKVESDGVTPKAGFLAWRRDIAAAAAANPQIDKYITSHVAAIESSEGVPKTGMLSADGVHPTPAGHTAMVDPLRAEIDALAARL